MGIPDNRGGACRGVRDCNRSEKDEEKGNVLR